MPTTKRDLLILDPNQTPPAGTIAPPRKPKWSDTFSFIANPDRFCAENLQKHGPIFKTSVFGTTTIFLGSANAIQMAFNGDFKYTDIALPDTTMDMFGEYSLVQRPDLHRSRKSALSPGLTGSILEHYTPQINQVIIAGLKHWHTTSNIASKLALYPAVEKICFEILTPLLLGVKLDESDPSSFAGLPITSQAELKKLYQTYFNGFFGLSKWKSPLTAYGRGLKARSELINFMAAVIQKRRDSGKIDPKADFLSMMLASQQENPEGIFSDALMENQCLLQLWASHYEISSLIASLIYQVGQHPEVLEKLRQEQAGLSGETRPNSPVSPESLKQMVFLEATIKETLRTLPPSSNFSRKLTKSVVLDNVLYEKGWVLIPEPRIAHIMTDYFAQPEKFDPERFLPERGEGKLYQFIPFGGGAHACLGAQMAILVTKIFASHVLRLFDWQVTGQAEFVQFPLKKIKDNYQVEIGQYING
jgi:cytochrome P450